MKALTYTQALVEALVEEMEADPRVLYLGEDIRHGGIFQGTKGLFERFGPERVISTPICEASFIGVGLGLALTGFRPIIEVMWADFTTCAADTIINSVAKMRFKTNGKVAVPMVIMTRQGGWIGHGASQSQCVEALFGHFPGLDIVMPGTPSDAKGLMKTSIRTSNPVLFLQPKSEIYGTREPETEQARAEHPLWARGGFKFPVASDLAAIPLGQADIKRPGDQITLVTWGSMLSRSLLAADVLAQSGASVEVIDLRTLRPLDEEQIFASVRRTHRLVIAQERDDGRVNVGQAPLRRGSSARLDHASSPRRERSPAGLHHAVAGARQSGVDAEDDHGL